jgi:hypothetical protein
MKDASHLLDLLSAGSDNIEPTKAVAGRSALYPDVRSLSEGSGLSIAKLLLVPVYRYFGRRRQGRQIASGAF